MRVAVHFPAEHPLAQDDGPAVVAYKLGRIEEGVHNAPIGHAPMPLEEFVSELVRQAQEEYPDAEIRVERLIDSGDGTGRWISADEFDPERHRPLGAGTTVQREVSADLAGGVVDR